MYIDFSCFFSFLSLFFYIILSYNNRQFYFFFVYKNKTIKRMNPFSSHSSSSSIFIYYNENFSYDDVEYVLGPLFDSYYGRRRLRSLIQKVDHIWCVYDRRTRQYIACALLDSKPDGTLYIQLFGVQQASQGQGIGTRLLRAIRRWARKSGYFAISLHTQIDNYQAIGLYEKVGFRKQSVVRDYYRRYGFLSFLEFNQPDAYLMSLYLR